LTNTMAQAETATFKRILLILGIGLMAGLALVQAATATVDEKGGTGAHAPWGAGDFASAYKVTASASGTLSSISLNFEGAQTGTYQVGVYASNGGNTAPTGAPLATCTDNAPAGGGWAVCTGLTATPAITMGTVYWLAEVTSTNAHIYYNDIGSGVRYYYPGASTLPNPWTDSGDTSHDINMRMTYAAAAANAPQFSGNITKLATPNKYDATAVHGFQITWDGGVAFNTTNVTFESNFTGAMANYTNATVPALFNTSATVFQINFTTMQMKGAAAYVYRWFGVNSTAGNVTQNVSYVIEPAAVDVQVSPMTQGITYPATVSQNCTNNATLGACTIWRGTANPPASNITLLNNTADSLEGGTWYYLANTTASQNYSSGTSAVQTITVTKAATTQHVALNGTEADTTYVYNVIVNATAWADITGGTVTFVRNGTGISSPFYGNLSARAHNFTATFSHANYTAAAVMRYFTVTKSATTTAISITPSASVSENTPITATVTSNISYVFYRDGTVITSPYTATLPFGTYNFTAALPDIENYTGGVTTSFLTVLPGGSGCTTPRTFAFTKTMPGTGNMSTLNFTDLRSAGLVKWDLSDVWLNTSNTTAYRNQSNGNYYLVVNTTNVTQFPVQFGNYIGNMSWANITNDTGVVTAFTPMTGYSELNPYYVLDFYEEATNVAQVPPGTNRMLSLFCSGGVSSFSFNQSRILVAATVQLDEIKATVSYSATEVYYRNLIARSSIEYRNYYLVDANINQVAQLQLTVFDTTGTYEAGDIIKVKKQIEGSLATITEGYIDAEMKIIVYLINADRYQIYIDDGTTERNIGYLYIDPTDLTKTIVINQGITEINYGANNVSASFNMTGSTITFEYFDAAARTTNVSFWVYNSAEALLYYANSLNHSSVSFAYVTADGNATYRVAAHATRTGFSELTMGRLISGLNQLLTGGDKLDTNVKVPATYMLALGLGLVCLVPMLFGGVFGAAAGVIAVFIAALLVYWGFLHLSVGLLILLGIFALFNAMRRR
jgi:hypothetical protein